MSHQGMDGWYPECSVCNGGNISWGGVCCAGCLREKFVSKDVIRKRIKERKKFWENKIDMETEDDDVDEYDLQWSERLAELDIIELRLISEEET